MKLPSGLLQGSPKIEGNSKTSDQGAALTVTSGWPQGSHSSLQCQILSAMEEGHE